MSASKQVIWDLLGKVLNQGVGFVISIILTRLLTPVEFGLVGMVMAVIFVSQIFLDLGFASGIIQKKNITDKQLSSIFFLNLAIGILLTLLFIGASGIISKFYERPELEPLVWVLSINLILYSLQIVQRSLFVREVNFKVQTKINFIAALISGVLGISLAFMGYGVWSLVLQNLFSALIKVIFYWCYSSWKPLWYFKFKEINEIWSFSVNIFFANLLNNLVARIDYLLVGKLFSATDLGYYSRAQSLNQLIVSYSSQSIGNVALPMVSRMQDNKEEVRKLLNKVVHFGAFAGVGLTLFFYTISHEMYLLLFGEEWLISAKMFQIIALYIYAGVVSYIVSQFIVGTGNSKLAFHLEIVKKTIFIFGYVIGAYFGVEGFVYGLVISRTLALFINMWGIQKIKLNTVFNQLKIVYQYVFLGLFSFFLFYLIPTINPDYLFFNIIVKSLIVILFFVTINIFFKTVGYYYLYNKIKILIK